MRAAIHFIIAGLTEKVNDNSDRIEVLCMCIECSSYHETNMDSNSAAPYLRLAAASACLSYFALHPGQSCRRCLCWMLSRLQFKRKDSSPALSPPPCFLRELRSPSYFTRALGQKQYTLIRSQPFVHTQIEATRGRRDIVEGTWFLRRGCGSCLARRKCGNHKPRLDLGACLRPLEVAFSTTVPHHSFPFHDA